MRAAHPRKRLLSALAVLALLFAATTSVYAKNELAGRWTLTITIPESQTATTTRTFTVTMEVAPRGESLHGRASITDEAGRTVSAAWRQAGKRASIAFELPCPGDGPCASLILQARIKGGGVLMKKGDVIVMWDSTNNRNPALYDTSNGSFRGDRIE